MLHFKQSLHSRLLLLRHLGLFIVGGETSKSLAVEAGVVVFRASLNLKSKRDFSFLSIFDA